MNKKLLLLGCAALWSAAPVHAATPAPESATRPAAVRAPVAFGSSTTSVPLYKSTVVTLPRSASRVSVGNPGVADRPRC